MAIAVRRTRPLSCRFLPLPSQGSTRAFSKIYNRSTLAATPPFPPQTSPQILTSDPRAVLVGNAVEGKINHFAQFVPLRRVHHIERKTEETWIDLPPTSDKRKPAEGALSDERRVTEMPELCNSCASGRCGPCADEQLARPSCPSLCRRGARRHARRWLPFGHVVERQVLISCAKSNSGSH